MNIPGMGLARQVEGTGNQVHIPMTRGLGVSELLKQTFQQMGKDHVSAWAGSLTYHFLFAIFPFLAFLFSLLGVFGQKELVDALLNRLGTAMPPAAIQLIDGQIRPMVENQNSGAFGFAAVVSILVALWGVSGAFRSIMEALNVMYNVEDQRPFWKKYLISIFLALGVVALLLSAVVLVIFGTSISAGLAGNTSLGSVFRWSWNVLQWPVLIFFVLLAFSLVYYYGPDVKQRFRFITPGSLIALVLWLVFSLAFSFYVSSFGSYNKTYGTLAGVVILMLYLYYSSFILLMGAEMNQIIEAYVPGGKDPGEKTPDDEKATGIAG